MANGNPAEEYSPYSAQAELERFINSDHNKAPENTVIPTGFAQIDKALGGGLHPGITVLGAKPAAGKSSLALQIAANIAVYSKKKFPVVYFSYEMTSAHLTAKLLNRHVNQKLGMKCTLRDIRSGKFTEEIRRELSESKALKNLYIFTPKETENGKQLYLSIDYIFKTIKAISEKTKKTPLAIIDYLQYAALMNNEANKLQANKTRESIERTLLRLALRSHRDSLPILVISSVNRASYENEPDITMFKDSGFIEFSADCLLALYEDPNSPPVEEEITPLNLKVMKNRYGMPNQIIRLDFNPSRDYFVEIKTSTIKRKKSNKTASSATSSAKAAKIPSEIESDLLPPDPQEQDEIDKLINS